MNQSNNQKWEVRVPPKFFQPNTYPRRLSYFQAEKKNIIIAFILLVVTIITTTIAGYGWDLEYRYALGQSINFPGEILHNPFTILRGLPFSLSLISILLTHEMGHFLTCRYYRVRTTPPFSIPFPSLPIILQSFGTLGAFIKIKEPFKNRNQLFDIGIAGPIAGMIPAIPLFFYGLSMSAITKAHPQGEVIIFGDSLLTYIGCKIFFHGTSTNMLVLHPIGWAAFFGFLATSINLLPIGQLDGGHIAYALLGRRGHRLISYLCLGLLIGVSVESIPVPGYLFFIFFLLIISPKHPPAIDDTMIPDVKRKILAVIALVIFLLTFIPIPVQIANW